MINIFTVNSTLRIYKIAIGFIRFIYTCMIAFMRILYGI